MKSRSELIGPWYRNQIAKPLSIKAVPGSGASVYPPPASIVMLRLGRSERSSPPITFSRCSTGDERLSGLSA
jgi:hypothetical protein